MKPEPSPTVRIHWHCALCPKRGTVVVPAAPINVGLEALLTESITQHGKECSSSNIRFTNLAVDQKHNRLETRA